MFVRGWNHRHRVHRNARIRRPGTICRERLDHRWIRWLTLEYHVGDNESSAPGSAPLVAPTLTPVSSTPTLVTPTLTDFAHTHVTWRAGKALAVFAKTTKRTPVGMQLSFTLNEAATVSLACTQSGMGRKSGTRCVAETTKSRKAKSCKRALALGTIESSAHSGKNTVAFQARVSNSKTHKPGRYTVTATAPTSRQQSKPSWLSFTIVK